MLENNFYSKKTNKCIVYDQKIINNLSQHFNLFIEVGMSSFVDSYRHKTQQIKKYILIVNFSENIIDDEKIRDIYMKDFQKMVFFAFKCKSSWNSRYCYLYVNFL